MGEKFSSKVAVVTISCGWGSSGFPRRLKNFVFCFCFCFFKEDLFMEGAPGLAGRRLVAVECVACGLAPHPSSSHFRYSLLPF